MVNIISMKLYKTKIPNIPNISAASRRISIALKEFAAQACMLASGARAHWILGIEDVPDSHCTDMLIENFSDGVFNFAIPINVIDKLTLVINDPLYKINWWNDRDKCTITYGVNTVVTTTLPNNFNVITASYTFVSFFNFTTADPVADKAIIDYLNSGEVIAQITGPNTLLLLQTITSVNPFLGVPLDTSSVTPLPPATQFDIYYEERRIFLPIEFLSLPDDST